MTAFSPKTPTEIVRYGFSLGPLVNHGETVATTVWSITTATGGSVFSASSMLFGSPIVDISPTVRHLIQGGIDGYNYTVGCQVVTSEGQVLETSATLAVSVR